MGASLRYLSLLLVSRLSVAGFNIATLCVNAAGCFFAGFIYAWTDKGQAPMAARLFFITGLIGAYTTLAAFGLECLYYLKNGSWLYFCADILLTNAVSLFMIWQGYKAYGWFA